MASIRPRALAAGLLACVLVLPGCAAAAVPLVSAGAAAGEAGVSFWKSGMLTYVDEGTTDEMHTAMTRMIQRLALTVHEIEDHFDDDGALQGRWWSIRSDRGHLVTIEMQALTEAMVQVKINAGPFGNRAAAELIASRLQAELDDVQNEVQDEVQDDVQKVTVDPEADPTAD